MSRLYGYAPCGERAVSSEPAAEGERLNTAGGLSPDGFTGGIEVSGTVNGEVSEESAEQILIPQLKPGKTVLTDNISFHHQESVTELTESHGAEVRFLPGYSPEFNPIEEFRSKIKARLRKKASKTVESLQKSITEAIQQVTLSDIRGWFKHAGYKIQLNRNE